MNDIGKFEHASLDYQLGQYSFQLMSVNKLASLEATLVETLPSDSLTGVK